MWLHTADPIANLCRRGRFFHEGQQRKLSRRVRHALFESGNAGLLGPVLLRPEDKLLAFFCFSARLAIELVDCVHEWIDDEQEDQRGGNSSYAGGHDDALA